MFIFKIPKYLSAYLGVFQMISLVNMISGKNVVRELTTRIWGKNKQKRFTINQLLHFFIFIKSLTNTINKPLHFLTKHIYRCYAFSNNFIILLLFLFDLIFFYYLKLMDIPDKFVYDMNTHHIIGSSGELM